MNKTKIEWCDYTWNPVTGCLHGCNYCYARRIAERFGGASETHYNECVGEECQWCTEGTGKIHDLTEPVYDVDRGHNAPYPFEFDPTFHRYRLDEPQKVKKPSKIFVVSMGDLFGEWVPDEWIKRVFEACSRAPWHTYLFLTKNPKRYVSLRDNNMLPLNLNAYFGATADNKNSLYAARDAFYEIDETTNDTFYSIEPLLEEMTSEMQFDYDKGQPFDWCKWVIVGAQTGPGAVKPNPEWVQSIIDQCREVRVPVFLKDNLSWPKKIQEWPQMVE